MPPENGDDSDEKHKEPSEAYFQELEQIQTIIERQANNSFKMKGWTVTLVVAVIIFRTGDYQTLLGFLPLISFWYLDSYYLKQERNFRKLYDWVRTNRLDSNEHFFKMNPSRFSEKTDTIVEIMKSKTQLYFYGIIGFLLFAAFIVSIVTTGNDINIISQMGNKPAKINSTKFSTCTFLLRQQSDSTTVRALCNPSWKDILDDSRTRRLHRVPSKKRQRAWR